jgi:hypothetical protein
MLPTFTSLFESHRWLCEKRGIRTTQRALDDAQIGIARARILAASLASRDDDEPAALLLALLLETDALGAARDSFPVLAVRTLVRSRGLDLEIDLTSRLSLRTIRVRALAYGRTPAELRASLDEARAFVTARLRPWP